RTLRLDQLIRHWVAHQIEVIVRRTRYLLRKAEERAHILRALLKAIDRIDEVITLIRGSASADAAKNGLMELLAIDDLQARAILDMQLRKLAALERQQLTSEYDELMAQIADYNGILASPERQRGIVRDELAEIVEKYGDDRRTEIVPYEGDMRMEDFIAEEDVVVTITRGGYAKRTRLDSYRAQKRGGKGVRGAQLKQDDIVQHFFVTTTHHWILFFTNKGRVYRTKAYELPELARDSRGQHVANLVPFLPDEEIAQVLALRDYGDAPYLVLATRSGLVKKTRLEDFDSARSSGIIAINLREDDELIAARLVFPTDDLLLISSNAQAIRFSASDESLRPMGRATSGVIGMRFSDGDYLLSMDVIREGEGATDVLVATDGGYAKRTPADQYPLQKRGGKGVLTAKIVETRGRLVGALMVDPGEDEILAITSNGGVIRTKCAEIKQSQRATMGVRLMNLSKGSHVVAIARNAEGMDEDSENGGDEVDDAE
ncbi:MAG TPA: DNA gyrase C-terminal beta-propeller domain-containing protein, partial [Thermobifida alba]|nr:DNA gyrase C-terminal beta-propeller domain-containing protein [Thermobifida alba]